MKSVIRYAVASALAVGFGLSSAWALTEVEARAELEKHAADARLDTEDRAAAIEALNVLVQEGVPVERAYDVVETAIDQGVTGPELADLAKYVEDRRDEGVTADTAVAELAARLEQREPAHENDMRDHARDYAADHREFADQRAAHETMDMPGAGGMDANMDMRGSEAGANDFDAGAR